MQIAIDKIKASPFQPRLEFDLEDLKGSIIKDGILTPITVRRVNENHYELIDGERRLRLAKDLGYKDVPCSVVDVDDETADRMVWKVNTLRKDYKPKEKALHYKHHQEQGMSLRGIARDHDDFHNNVAAYLNVFRLDEEYQELIWDGPLSVGHIQVLESNFNNGGSILPIQSKLRIAEERGLSVAKFREMEKPSKAQSDKRRVEAAQKEAENIINEPEVKIETPEDYEKAAEALKREAKKRREAELTPGKKTEIIAEQNRKKEEQKQKTKERAEQLKQEREKEIQKRADERARNLKKEELIKDEDFVKEVISEYEIIKQRELASQPKEQIYIPLPEGKYRTIVIDPPWPMPKIFRKLRPNQFKLDYPPMTLEEIETLPIPELAYQDGCHIYLWTTHKYLPTALGILDIWGAKYECLLTWVKNVGITPFSWMYSTEHCLFARIGSLPLVKLGKRLDFRATVREHSRKPDEFYNLVKEVSPEPRLDMFSREKREDFAQYGNEVDKFSPKQVAVIGG